MDNRQIVKVRPKADYYWYCPECNARNEEVVIPNTPDLTCQKCGANYKNGSDLPRTPKCEILTLVVLGAWRSPISDLCLYVEGEAGFDYIMLKDGKFMTVGSLRPELIEWLLSPQPSAELGPGWTNHRLVGFPIGEMEFVVHYGSTHHRDER